MKNMFNFFKNKNKVRKPQWLLQRSKVEYPINFQSAGVSNKIINNFVPKQWFARFINPFRLDNTAIGTLCLWGLYCSSFLAMLGLLGYFVDVKVLAIIVSFIISFAVSFLSGYLFKGYDNWFVRFVLRNFIVRGVINVCLITLVLSSFIYLDLYLDLNLGNIYCDGEDDAVNNNNSDNSNINSNVSLTTENKNNEQYSINVGMSIDKELGKNLVDGVTKTLGNLPGLDDVIGTLGSAAAAGTAAGSIASTVAKTNLPLGAKTVAVGVLTGVAAGSTFLAVSTAKNLVKNREENKRLNNEYDHDSIPSTNDDTFIYSPNDYNIFSPLEELLGNQIAINVLLIISMIFLLFILFTKLFIKQGLFSFVLTQEKSILNIKYNKYTNMFEQFNEKYFMFVFIFLFIIVIFLLLLNLLISVELSNSIDDYVRVHNHIKGIK
jgi:hypothetical protein